MGNQSDQVVCNGITPSCPPSPLSLPLSFSLSFPLSLALSLSSCPILLSLHSVSLHILPFLCSSIHLLPNVSAPPLALNIPLLFSSSPALTLYVFIPKRCLFLYVSRSLYLSTYLSMYLSTYLSIYLSMYLSIQHSIDRSIYFSSPSLPSLSLSPSIFLCSLWPDGDKVLRVPVC